MYIKAEGIRLAHKATFGRSEPFIVVGAPAFNEEKISIARVILLAKEHADKVIVCDDGSTDLTEQRSTVKA